MHYSMQQNPIGHEAVAEIGALLRALPERPVFGDAGLPLDKVSPPARPPVRQSLNKLTWQWCRWVAGLMGRSNPISAPTRQSALA